jgi:hypothetical protein
LAEVVPAFDPYGDPGVMKIKMGRKKAHTTYGAAVLHLTP